MAIARMIHSLFSAFDRLVQVRPADPYTTGYRLRVAGGRDRIGQCLEPVGVSHFPGLDRQAGDSFRRVPASSKAANGAVARLWLLLLTVSLPSCVTPAE